MYTLSWRKLRTWRIWIRRVSPENRAKIRRSSRLQRSNLRKSMIRPGQSQQGMTRGREPPTRNNSNWLSRERLRGVNTTTSANTKIIHLLCRDLKTRAKWSRRTHFMPLEMPWLLLLRPRTRLLYLPKERIRQISSYQFSSKGRARRNTRKETWTLMESKMVIYKIPIATTPMAQSFRDHLFSCCLNLSRVQEVKLTRRRISSKSSWLLTQRSNQRRSLCRILWSFKRLILLRSLIKLWKVARSNRQRRRLTRGTLPWI